MTTPHRPKPFCTFTTPAMWNDPHISAHMLVNHLDPDSSLTSRSHSFINHSAEWIISLLRLCSGDHVLDLGCGPGLYACRLARKGISMTGIDVSARSLDHARAVAVREGLPATFAQGSYLDFDLDQDFDAAILIYEDYCALSPGQRANLLGRITASLKNGGHFLFDVTASPRFSDFSDAIVETKNLMGGFWSAAPYHGRLETWTYPDLRLVLEKYTIITRSDAREYYNWTQCLSPEQVTQELSEAGLAVSGLFNDVTGSPYDPRSTIFAVLAHKHVKK